ncbi:MAG: hypothetical protein E6Q75_00975 [Rheinheimera sp.]|nr:MAG: hypothetical protein E6Q75_00975 [Rheinheimera sp.]
MSNINPKDYKFELFSLFPNNCCEYTSYLLAKYLHENHYKKTQMLHGENRYKKNLRHTWLKFGEIDIDITADQFHSTDRTVFVMANSRWHERFNIFRSEIPNINLNHLHEEPKLQLLEDYKNIVSIIDKRRNYA